MDDVRTRAEAWLAADPDPDTRAELQALVAADGEALRERFATRLEFGTAGIRGPLGAGPSRMNRLLVRRVTAGLAARLLADAWDAAARGVVVGRDARHKSAEFAVDTADVLAGAGIRVHVFERPVPTPLLAFAVRHLGAAAGVQITASHNPAGDNGYKVFWSTGAQILPPLDAEISAAIDAVEGVHTVPADAGPLVSAVDPQVYAAYVRAALALVTPGGPRELRIVYTPLHGVALDVARGLLYATGFRDVEAVPEQAEPDPDFPTVPFPNPEEPGALDRALALASAKNADLVLANDPDGDRLAVAVPQGTGWRALSGDEVGCLLAEDLLARHPGGLDRIVATTVVSSRLLAGIAGAHGAGYVETLTGFKWLAAAAAAAEAEGRRMVLAYEQALGVMVGTAVRDKDGLSAALLVADLAARLKAQGRTLIDLLDDLARRHGLHLTGGVSVRLEDDPTLVDRTLTRLRAAPPRRLGAGAVVEVADYLAGTRTRPDGTTERLSTPPTDMVGLTLEDGSRVQVRPSGTEPLLKFYGEVIGSAGGDVSAARVRAGSRLAALLEAFTAATAFS